MGPPGGEQTLGLHPARMPGQLQGCGALLKGQMEPPSSLDTS